LLFKGLVVISIGTTNYYKTLILNKRNRIINDLVFNDMTS